MEIFKVTFKEKDQASYWDNKALLVVASNYSNAEDKAKNFPEYMGREILSIMKYGQTTSKSDVYKLNDR